MNSPRERVFASLTGGRPDRGSFVIWDNKIPDPATLRALAVPVMTDLDARRRPKENQYE